MASPPSHVQALLPDPSCLKLSSVEHQAGGRVLISAAAVGSVAYCPACHHASHSLHSRYSRALQDLPCQGATVELRLDVRRFRCRAHDCPRVTFAETLPAVAVKYGRQTSRLSEAVRLIGYVLGGEAGSRLSNRLGMATSPDTVLRRLKVGPSVEVRGAKAVGIDDWAWRKGQRYGTILVDLESHTPIDLLPDRSADSLATWLQAHPGAEVVSRDRGGIYADGATRGAPQAIQVADRFHLLCNLTAAVERVLESKRNALAKAVVLVPVTEPAGPPADSRPKAKSRLENDREERRQRRVDRYNEVIGLHRQGMSQQAISLTLHIQRKTIRRFVRAGRYPERATPHRRPPGINRFQEFLLRRWGEGCHNATKLWHEIQGQGYTGGRSTMAKFIATLRVPGTTYFRPTAAPRQKKAKPPSPRQAAMLLARRPEKLKPDQAQLLAKLNECCPEIPILYDLTQGFAQVFRDKQSEHLQTWIDHARGTGLLEIGHFCDGLRRDEKAVNAAVILPWSNGQVEGQIHRLKLVKRQMYGRAKFNLLRRRVLPYVAAAVTAAPQCPP
jgi:transposase